MKIIVCPTREEVIDSVACPVCEARIGEECWASAGSSRERNHQARRNLSSRQHGQLIREALDAYRDAVKR
jgi:hypothetical protein